VRTIEDTPGGGGKTRNIRWDTYDLRDGWAGLISPKKGSHCIIHAPQVEGAPIRNTYDLKNDVTLGSEPMHN